TIAYSRPRLSVELIGRALERDDFRRIQCASEARIQQSLRRTPRTGFATAFRRPQSEIARREHEADTFRRRFRCPRLPTGEHSCAGHHREFSPRHVHGWLRLAAASVDLRDLGEGCAGDVEPIATANMPAASVRKFFHGINSFPLLTCNW